MPAAWDIVASVRILDLHRGGPRPLEGVGKSHMIYCLVYRGVMRLFAPDLLANPKAAVPLREGSAELYRLIENLAIDIRD